MQSDPHVLIACGGTGGHLFPGIAVAQELARKGAATTILISEKEVDARASEKYSDLSFVTVPAIAKPSSFSPRMLPFLWKLHGTIKKCRAILEEKAITAVLGMGGFTSFPPIFAAHQADLPTFIHDSNAVPGRSNLLTARFADHILLGFSEAASSFAKRPTTVTGTPVRSELAKLPTQAEARQTLGLDPELPVVLVIGGSQGARALNDLVIEGTRDTGWQILHLTGQSDFERMREATASLPHHHPMAFCDDMASAYAAATFALTRAGASTLTELAHAGLPALLVPYPYAADDHQTANARVFEKAGAALLVQESELSADRLRAILAESRVTGHRSDMHAAACRLQRPLAARRIAETVLAA